MSLFSHVEAPFLAWLRVPISDELSQKYQTFGIYGLDGGVQYEIEVAKYKHDFVPPFGRLGKTLVLVGLEMNDENQRKGHGTETCLRLWHHAQGEGFEAIHLQCAGTEGAIALGQRLVASHGWKQGGNELCREFIRTSSVGTPVDG